ncbi:MAG: hypothetical protein ABSC55_08700 [Syntrophorhabdales bacterium]|jgi:uncharacterized coiled-coil protein SlyX
MKVMFTLIALLVFSSGAFAQTMEDRLNSLEQTLKNQEQTIQQLKALQDTLQKQEQAIEEQRKLIEELKAAAKQPQPAAPPAAAATPQAMPPGEVQQQVKELKEQVDQVVEAQKKIVPSVFNPAIGFVGETLFSYNSKNSQQTGSSRPGGWDVFQRSIELNAAASVDPFARGYVVLNATVDPTTGEATAGVEEAAIVTTSLPWNLTVKGGRFFGEFGRLSYIHDHELPFVNRPLVLDQYVGGESKTDGVQLNYLLPISHYVSLTAGTGTQFGDTPNNVGTFRAANNLNYWGRASTYFDLTPNISFEPGLSGMWNPNTIDLGGPQVQPNGSISTERQRRIVGTDITFAYKPLRDNQFKSLTWSTEVLYSNNRYDVASPDGTLSTQTVPSYGLYSYLAYKLHRQWTVGTMFEWMENVYNNEGRTSAYSGWVTWALSHWNQLRLQYTHTNNNAATGLQNNDAVYLQWSWIIGSHAHGWQER